MTSTLRYRKKNKTPKPSPISLNNATTDIKPVNVKSNDKKVIIQNVQSSGCYCLDGYGCKFNGAKSAICPIPYYNRYGEIISCRGLCLDVPKENFAERIIEHLVCTCANDCSETQIYHRQHIPNHTKTSRCECNCSQIAGNTHHLRRCHGLTQDLIEFKYSAIYMIYSISISHGKRIAQGIVSELFPNNNLAISFINNPTIDKLNNLFEGEKNSNTVYLIKHLEFILSL